MGTISPPVVVTKEGKWFIARCPAMDLVTQGRTEEEAVDNMKDLIDEYLSDPDIPKPKPTGAGQRCGSQGRCFTPSPPPP